MRATFSIDEKTDATLRRMAETLGLSKSAVVRQALSELEARGDRLTEKERQEKLAILQALRTKPPSRSQADVNRELEELGTARRAGWRRGS